MSQHHSHHITSLPVLFGTFAALIALTVLTVVLADPDFKFGKLDMVITMGIAIVKAALVALIFMQLMHDKLLNSVILVGSLMFLALFLGISLMDRLQYQPEITSYVEDHLPAPVTPEPIESENLQPAPGDSSEVIPDPAPSAQPPGLTDETETETEATDSADTESPPADETESGDEPE